MENVFILGERAFIVFLYFMVDSTFKVAMDGEVLISLATKSE
jgi:hypothetical protein